MQAPTPTPAIVPGMQHRANIKALTTKQLRFEIDMCIGCDRCMLTCPVPFSSKITIADLNAATIDETIPAHIASFADACVMCGSCVPVCPVGNHRDLMMLSLKQRLGASWNGPVDMARVQRSIPAGWTLPFLLGRLRELPMFRNPQLIPDSYLLHLIAESSILTRNAGAILFHEGDFGREISYILDGQVELSATGPNAAALPIAILGRGEYVGDYGMVTGHPQYATARAQTGVLLLVVSEQIMQRLMELVPAVQGYFEQRTTANRLPRC